MVGPFERYSLQDKAGLTRCCVEYDGCCWIGLCGAAANAKQHHHVEHPNSVPVELVGFPNPLETLKFRATSICATK
jgi:hypothetical protein